MVKPFESRQLYIQSMLNEASVLLVGYLTLSFTGLITDENTKYNIGWIVVVIVLLNILINTVVLWKEGIQSIIKFVRKHILKSDLTLKIGTDKENTTPTKVNTASSGKHLINDSFAFSEDSPDTKPEIIVDNNGAKVIARKFIFK